MPTTLRAVGPDDPPPVRRKLTITQAADNGTERELLVSLRERVAVAVEDQKCPPRDLAALSRRLTEITKEIAAIDAREVGDDTDAEVGDGAFDAAAV